MDQIVVKLEDQSNGEILLYYVDGKVTITKYLYLYVTVSQT